MGFGNGIFDGKGVVGAIVLKFLRRVDYIGLFRWFIYVITGFYKREV